MFPRVGKFRTGLSGVGKGLREVLEKKQMEQWGNKSRENLGGQSIMTGSDNGGFIEKHEKRCADRNAWRANEVRQLGQPRTTLARRAARPDRGRETEGKAGGTIVGARASCPQDGGKAENGRKGQCFL